MGIWVGIGYGICCIFVAIICTELYLHHREVTKDRDHLRALDKDAETTIETLKKWIVIERYNKRHAKDLLRRITGLQEATPGTKYYGYITELQKAGAGPLLAEIIEFLEDNDDGKDRSKENN